MRGYAVRIDLQTPQLRFLATPDNGDRPDHTDGLRTSSFLTRYKCQLAINASPFSPIHATEGKPQKIVGLTISGGRVVSPEQPGYPALLLTKDNRATIAEPPFKLDGVENAVCGFNIVLREGQPIRGGQRCSPPHGSGYRAGWQDPIVTGDRRPAARLQSGGNHGGSRTLAGQAGGPQWSESRRWGTSTLVIEQDPGFKIVNRPIHGGKSGTERVAASHLGIYAPPLKNKR